MNRINGNLLFFRPGKNLHFESFRVEGRKLALSESAERDKFWEEIRDVLQLICDWECLTLFGSTVSRNTLSVLSRLSLPINLRYLPEIERGVKLDEMENLLWGEYDEIGKAVFIGDFDLVKEICSPSPTFFYCKYNLDRNKYSLLDIAIIRSHKKIFDYLLTLQRKEEGVFFQVNTSRETLFKNPEYLRALIERGYLGQLAEKDANGFTPVHYAAMRKNTDELRKWLNFGAPVDILSHAKNGKIVPQTPLWIAVQMGYAWMVSFLLARGANPNAGPLLYIAIENGANVAILHMLLNHKARIDVSHQGRLPLTHANWKGRNELFEIVLNRPISSGEELQAVLDEMNHLRGKHTKSEINERDRQLSRIARTWIYKLSPDLCNSTYKGIPLLHQIILCCDEDLAIAAVQRGANANSITVSKITALTLAVMRNYLRLADLLLKRGADPTIRDYTGAAALNHALDYPRTLDFAKQHLGSKAWGEMDPFYLYDSHKQLKITWLYPHADKIKKENPDLRDRWKEFYYAKVCSHLFAQNGKGEAIPKDPNIPHLVYWREGLLSPMKLFDKVGKWTERMEFLPKKIKDHIVEFCSYAANNLSLTNGDYIKRIRAGLPTLILSASLNHSFNILIYKRHFVICNGNFEKFYFQVYKEAALTEEIIERVRIACAYSDPDCDVQEIYFEIGRILQIESHSQTDEFANWMFWVKQTIGNCTYKGLEGAVSAYFVLEFLGEEDDALISISPPISKVPSAEIQRELMKKWILELKVLAAEKYVGMHEKEEFKYYPDPFLLKNMEANLRDDEHSAKIKKLIARIQALKTPKRNEEFSAFTRDPCYSHFTFVPLPEKEITFSKLLGYRSNYPVIPARPI